MNIRKELKQIGEYYPTIPAEHINSLTDFLKYVKVRRPEHNYQKYYSLKEGDTYVEAGAFWGTNGIKASEKVGSTGRVILIEPSPITFTLLKKVVKFYKLYNVSLVEKAVWNKNGLMFFDFESRPTNHCLKEDGGMLVLTDTLDNILIDLDVEKVDLFAADVEGAEVGMIEGCKVYLGHEKIRNVAIAAYHNQKNFEAISRFLGWYGFKEITWDFSEQGILYSSLTESG